MCVWPQKITMLCWQPHEKFRLVPGHSSNKSFFLKVTCSVMKMWRRCRFLSWLLLGNLKKKECNHLVIYKIHLKSLSIKFHPSQVIWISPAYYPRYHSFNCYSKFERLSSHGSRAPVCYIKRINSSFFYEWSKVKDIAHRTSQPLSGVTLTGQHIYRNRQTSKLFREALLQCRNSLRCK